MSSVRLRLDLEPILSFASVCVPFRSRIPERGKDDLQYSALQAAVVYIVKKKKRIQPTELYILCSLLAARYLSTFNAVTPGQNAEFEKFAPLGRTLTNQKSLLLLSIPAK